VLYTTATALYWVWFRHAERADRQAAGTGDQGARPAG
jgi:hypothetical protein